MNSPLVSVIIPVYNAELFIEKALLSILNQTHENLEVIVINDGSTDSSASIISRITQNDERINFFSRENKGLVYTLNEMLSLCSSQYIARMDADDISEPHRIETQLKLLMKRSDLAMVGSQTSLIDECGRVIGKRSYPTKSRYIATYFLYGNPIAHPTVMFNRCSAGVELYYSDKPEHENVEDIELWLRILRFKKIENIPTPLLKYRLVSSSITSRTNLEQKKKDLFLRREFWKESPRALEVCDKVFIGCTEKNSKKIITAFWDILILSFENKNVSTLYSINIFLRALKNSRTVDKRFIDGK
ncbi:glycosyltransferase family 2 protein [Serratia fonticola]|uniref:glycosyltransferase family 2 protein n=1 Tax=Serratia fonticola TaxID=47917 RepID=UPI00217ABF21|nr:glycosyltransferase [Serratia fonticola]CAI1954720.1 Hyaluronan synthase [Serratia fonticola]